MEHPHSHHHGTAAKECCDAPAGKADMHQGHKPSAHAHHGSHGGGSLASLTTSATIHCLIGGVTAPSIFAPQFWLGYALALPAGFIAAWPVNYWLLKSSVKQPCH